MLKQAARIGVVIPALNEGKVIGGNCRTLLRDPYVGSIVVVDGGSTDRTCAEVARLAERHPDRLRLVESAAGRGLQMNAGAQLLDVDWLVFHHADSTLPADAGRAIAALPASVSWGGFRHRFEPSNWKLALISRMHNLRCRFSGAVYGDQSMFVRRELFDRIGGFSETGIEDLIFSDRALACCRPCLLPLYVRTASRKFRQIGELRALAQTVSIVWRYERQRRIGHEAFFEPYR